jgi:PKD repeat protein
MTAAFTSDVTQVCETEGVQFTDASVGDITSWNWTFEGGNPETSSEQNPLVIYENEGVFDVELTISDGTNSSTVTLEDYITVLMMPPVMLMPFEMVCVYWPAFELSGGSPANGEYSGPGVIDGWFDPNVAGLGTHIITYTYTALNGCDNSAQQPIIVDACTGIEEPGDEPFAIYPNPTTGNFRVKLNGSGLVTISVFNVLSEQVYYDQVSISGLYSAILSLQGEESGMYFVRIQSMDGIYVRKLQLTD